jgi:hypothetical protein
MINTMSSINRKKAFMALILIPVLIATMFGTLSCGEKKAQSPEYEIGNQWVYKMEYQGLIHDVTIEVTDTDIINDKECYVTVWKYQPALEGTIPDMSVWVDKTTDLPVMAQATGTMMGVHYSAVMDYVYLFPGENWWPLEVGKEIEISETIHRTTKASGRENKETETKTSTYEVVRIEEITVLAGTFDCFKIIEHDESGMKLSETWYSDDVKNDVKYIDYAEGYTIELKSHSM